LNASAFTELRAVYARLATELEPFRRSCDTRGVCCNFTKTGHMLYVTGLEAAEMANSGEAPDLSLAAAGTCPFLKGKMCGIREHRALGCRIYFCDRTYEEDRNAIYERYLKEIRQIEAAHGIDHTYQPMTSVDFVKAKSA
jgi:Fe-S-cluster containining protein